MTNLPATTNDLADIAKVLDAELAGDVIAHRLAMLAMRTPATSEGWDKATKAAAVDWLEHAVDLADGILKTNSAEWIVENARTKLQGDIDAQIRVIEAAEAGDHVAHDALTKMYWQMVNAGDTPPVVVTSYVARANLRPPPRRKRGAHTPHDHLHRDQTLMNLIVLACLRFGLAPTRNREMKLAGHPCGASLVVKAVRRRRIMITESRLANMWTEGGGARGVAAITKYVAHMAKKPGFFAS